MVILMLFLSLYAEKHHVNDGFRNNNNFFLNCGSFIKYLLLHLFYIHSSSLYSYKAKRQTYSTAAEEESRES